MNALELKAQLTAARPFVCWLEIEGLLHDVGKLSKEFLQYRREWRTLPDSSKQDPHSNQWTSRDPLLPSHVHEPRKLSGPPREPTVISSGPPHRFDVLMKELRQPLSGRHFSAVPRALAACLEHNIAAGIDYHVNPDDLPDTECEGTRFPLRLLRLADRIDAMDDRNNPLFCNEQTGDVTYQGDVYGWERPLPPDPCDAREQLYQGLTEILPRYSDALTNGTGWMERLDLVGGLDEGLDGHLGVIRRSMETSLSDTTRPQNDTTLWEHAYAVATFYKLLVSHCIIRGLTEAPFQGAGPEIEGPRIEFSVLGVGWDGLVFLSNAHRLGDVLGRKQVLDVLKAKIRKLVEWEYNLGNSMYDDDDGIYFFIPVVKDSIAGSSQAYNEVLAELKRRILQIALDGDGVRPCHGDIIPRVEIVENAGSPTRLVEAIRRVRRGIRTPVVTSEPLAIQQLLEKAWAAQPGQTDGLGRSVCPVCGRRPVHKEGDDRSVCETCLRRRQGHWKPEDNQTPFLSEIAAGSGTGNPTGRLALVVARMGLERWMNGELVRTLFVTERDGLLREVRELGQTVDTKKAETENGGPKDFFEKHPQTFKYLEIERHIELLRREGLAAGSAPSDDDEKLRNNLAFLYCYRWSVGKSDAAATTLKRLEDQGRKERDPDDARAGAGYPLPQLVCSKTPTPSTVLDTWMATQRYFETVQESVEKTIEAAERVRVRTVTTGWNPQFKHPYDCELSWTTSKGIPARVRVEIVWPDRDDPEIAWVLAGESARRLLEEAPGTTSATSPIMEGRILGDDHSQDPSRRFSVNGSIPGSIERLPFSPFRVVSSTPNIFMAVVPLASADDVVHNMREEYERRYGKVWGRLPLSVGVLAFPQQMPMFAILDGARRMIDGFRSREEATDPEGGLLRMRVDAVGSIGADDSRSSVALAGTVDPAGVADPADSPGVGENADAEPPRHGPPTRRIRLSHVPPDGASPMAGYGRVEIEFPLHLGAGEKDMFHAYLRVEEPQGAKAGEGLVDRPGYFATWPHPVLHVSDLAVGDVVLVQPNTYYAQFLGSASARLSIEIGSDPRRWSLSHRRRRASQLLDHTSTAERIWTGLDENRLVPGLTNTRLYGLEALWLTKREDWQLDEPDEDRPELHDAWRVLVKASLHSAGMGSPAAPKTDEPGTPTTSGEPLDVAGTETAAGLAELADQGFLLDMLEWRLHVRKDRIKS